MKSSGSLRRTRNKTVPVTETWFPRSDASRIVLIGAGAFRDRTLPPIAAVENNLRDLKDAFTHPEHGLLAGQPSGHCTVLGLDGESVDQAAVGNALHRASSEAEDLLLVYYSGHGLLDDEGLLYLAFKHTDPERLRYTALSLDVIKRDLATAPARARVLILDCCFSGRAIAAMGTASSLVLGQLDTSGTYTLTSTTANAPSHAPPGDRHSAFTAVLLKALAVTEPLNMDQIYHYAQSELRDLGLPSPQRRGTGAASWLALARGPLPHPPLPTPTPRRPLRPMLLWPLAAAVIAAALAVPALLLPQDRSTKGTGVSRSAATSPAPSTTTRSTPPPTTSGPSDSTSAPQTQDLKVKLFETGKTSDGSVIISLNGAVGMTSQDGAKGAFGGGKGQTGGGGGVRVDGLEGGTASGFASLLIDTFNRTCTVNGLAVGESTVVPGPSRTWTKVVVVAVENTARSSDAIYATLRISQGKDNPPQENKRCA